MIPHLNVFIVQDAKENRFEFRLPDVNNENEASRLSEQNSYSWGSIFGFDSSGGNNGVRVWITFVLSDEERKEMDKKVRPQTPPTQNT
jgi:hypothetical protein